MGHEGLFTDRVNTVSATHSVEFTKQKIKQMWGQESSISITVRQKQVGKSNLVLKNASSFLSLLARGSTVSNVVKPNSCSYSNNITLGRGADHENNILGYTLFFLLVLEDI